MTAIFIRADLTDAQKRALKWLDNRGGSGMFTRGQVLLAQGDLAGVMRATWNVLATAKPACVIIEKKRVTLTDAGRVVARTCRDEAATVEDE